MDDRPKVPQLDLYDLVPPDEWRNGLLPPDSKLYAQFGWKAHANIRSDLKLMRAFDLYPHLYWLICQDIRRKILDRGLYRENGRTQLWLEGMNEIINEITVTYSVEFARGPAQIGNSAAPDRSWVRRAFKAWCLKERQTVQEKHPEWKIHGMPARHEDLVLDPSRKPHGIKKYKPWMSGDGIFNRKSILIAFPGHHILRQHDLLLVNLVDLEDSVFSLAKLFTIVKDRTLFGETDRAALYFTKKFHHTGSYGMIRTGMKRYRLTTDANFKHFLDEYKRSPRPCYELKVRTLPSPWEDTYELADAADHIEAFDGAWPEDQYNEKVPGTLGLLHSLRMKKAEQERRSMPVTQLPASSL